MNSVFKIIANKDLKIFLFESASSGYIAYKISQDQQTSKVFSTSYASSRNWFMEYPAYRREFISISSPPIK